MTMSSKDKIEIEELRKAVNLLLDHLRDGGIRQVELGKDCYWELDAERLYDVTNDPTDFSIGSLFDDLESVQKLASGQREPVVLLLLKVAPLLRYLGDTVTEVQLTKPAEEGS
jgi:hypothetical protein